MQTHQHSLIDDVWLLKRVCPILAGPQAAFLLLEVPQADSEDAAVTASLHAASLLTNVNTEKLQPLLTTLDRHSDVGAERRPSPCQHRPCTLDSTELRPNRHNRLYKAPTPTSFHTTHTLRYRPLACTNRPSPCVRCALQPAAA